jgi:hypothetical protein
MLGGGSSLKEKSTLGVCTFAMIEIPPKVLRFASTVLMNCSAHV